MTNIIDVTKKISEKSIKEKYAFELVCTGGDKIILKAYGSSDYESWKNDICLQISLMRDNKNIINSENEINKIYKECFDNDLEIVGKSLNLRGLLSLSITKELILK